MKALVFDIETVPDVELGRKLYELGDLSDEEVAKVMCEKCGSEFLPHVQHRIVAISCVFRGGGDGGPKVWSVGQPGAGEAEIVGRFYEGIDKLTPNLISWNGSGFDLPVLHYRALKHGIVARQYWETGNNDHEFRYNNYLARFHWRHMDLMDVLSGCQVRARASLNDMAALLGFPGKLGFSGAQVWGAYLAGEIVHIRQYCETDVLNTYLVYLRFELMRGVITLEQYVQEIELVKNLLRNGRQDQPHFAEFLQAWEAIT